MKPWKATTALLGRLGRAAPLPAPDSALGATARQRSPRVALAGGAPVVAVAGFRLVLPAQWAVAERARVKGTGGTVGERLGAASGERGAVLRC